MFLVCGEALWDLFAVEAESGLSFDARIGGSPFNVSMGLSRLGQKSALLTGLSTDRLGERLFAALKREGVDPRYLVRTSQSSTIGLVRETRAAISTKAAPRSMPSRWHWITRMPSTPP